MQESQEPILTKKTCKHCKKQYIPGGEDDCTFHPGIYSGRLNRINDVDTSDLEFFWSCCGEYELGAMGCVRGRKHVSYDDDDSTKYSIATGKEVDYSIK